MFFFEFNINKLIKMLFSIYFWPYYYLFIVEDYEALC